MAQFNQADSNKTLGNLILQRITESSFQRITFAEFMELALYAPDQGYYVAQTAKIGAVGDFFTSPHLGSDFGELLAEQFVQIWQTLQSPVPFTLVEMGAGQGLLAGDILRYLQRHHPECYRSLRYLIVERAAILIAEQKQQLQAFQSDGLDISWCELTSIPADSITGCFFSNELVDAFPVHQVVVEAGQLREVYVTATTDEQENIQFTEVVGELSTPDLVSYFELVGIDLRSPTYPDRYRTEVNLAALDWLTKVANCLHRGYVLTIDYGYPASRFYHPSRSQGTLQCYYQHAHHSNPYLYLGHQDLTAHVDFTALERQGETVGLQTLGWTQQGLFLMALGLGERIAALSQSETRNIQEINARLQRREALHSLINPRGLGNFGVLIQGKGLSSSETVHPLKGLTIPAM